MDIGDQRDTGTATTMDIIMDIIVAIEAVTVQAIMREIGTPLAGLRTIPAGLWLRITSIKTVLRV